MKEKPGGVTISNRDQIAIIYIDCIDDDNFTMTILTMLYWYGIHKTNADSSSFIDTLVNNTGQAEQFGYVDRDCKLNV